MTMTCEPMQPVSTTLRPVTIALLDRLAQQQSRSRSSMLRIAVERYVAQYRRDMDMTRIALSSDKGAENAAERTDGPEK